MWLVITAKFSGKDHRKSRKTLACRFLNLLRIYGPFSRLTPYFVQKKYRVACFAEQNQQPYDTAHYATQILLTGCTLRDDCHPKIQNITNTVYEQCNQNSRLCGGTKEC